MGCGPSQEEYPPQGAPTVNGAAGNSLGVEQPLRTQSASSRVSGGRSALPPPRPPVKSKKEIFKIQDYKKIDAHALKVTHDMLYSGYTDLVKFLLKPCKTDLERVRVLFKWIASVNITELQASLTKLPEQNTPLDYILKIHWNLGNHAHLFHNICRAAEIPCVIVTGMNKNAGYQLGQKLNRDYVSAQWNAVLIDGEWRFIDVFWASTCLVGSISKDWILVDDEADNLDDDDEENKDETLHRINEFFFIPDPEHIIYTHFPFASSWQLRANPVTEQQFENMIYIRERFFELDMSLLSDSFKECVVECKSGEIVIPFALDPKVASKYQFRYLLYRSRARRDSVIPIPLERFVFFQKTKDKITYHIDFPLAGMFKLDIFGQHSDHETLNLVCSYMIDCKTAKKDVTPLPDAPDIGWGPGAEAEDVGLKATSHQDPVIETSDGHATLRFKSKNALNVMQNLRHNALDEWILQKYAVIRTEGDELIIDLRLPDKGQYALNMFADGSKAEGDMANVCNYLIKSLRDNNIDPFPKLHEGLLGKGFMADKLGVKAVSHPGGLITTEDGKLEIKMESGDDVELICEIHNNDLGDDVLSEISKQSRHGKTTSFDMNFPQAGEYAVNVYARKKSDPSKIHHVHTYMVQSSQQGDKVQGSRPAEEEVEVLEVTSGTCLVRLPASGRELVAEVQRHNAQQGPDSNPVESSLVGDEQNFKVKLGENGRYKMDVFEKKPNGALVKVKTYEIVKRDLLPGEEEEEEETLDPEEAERRRMKNEKERENRRLKEQLRKAMSSQNPEMIKAAINDLEASGCPDAAKDIRKAKDLLEFMKHSAALTTAMNSRNLNDLEKAVSGAEKSPVAQKLLLQIEMAKRIRDRLRKMEKLKSAVLNMDNKMVAEMKSYSQPPEAVHQVMMATFLILGEQKSKLKDWKSCVVLIGKTGKESLKRRVGQFNPSSLKADVAAQSKKILDAYFPDEIGQVSQGAATFYVWGLAMIEEAEGK